MKTFKPGILGLFSTKKSRPFQLKQARAFASGPLPARETENLFRDSRGGSNPRASRSGGTPGIQAFSKNPGLVTGAHLRNACLNCETEFVIFFDVKC